MHEAGLFFFLFFSLYPFGTFSYGLVCLFGYSVDPNQPQAALGRGRFSRGSHFGFIEGGWHGGMASLFWESTNWVDG
jgi:hypothetical protein